MKQCLRRDLGASEPALQERGQWPERHEPSLAAAEPKTTTEKLRDGEDLWALLRCAYLSGADSCGAASDVSRSSL